MRRIIILVLGLCINIQIFSQGITIDAPVTMLALGDSYTIGASVGTEERWPHQFVAELNAMGLEAGTPDYIAVTGWTTRDLLGGIERQLDTTKEYNLVSILIGVNNQYQRQDIEIYEPDLREIIEIALEVVSGDAEKVFMVSIPDYAYTPFGNGDANISAGIDAYNDINYRIAVEYGLTYVNVTTISRRGLEEPDLVASDGLHPSGAQYALWVEAILSWIAGEGTVGLNRSAGNITYTYELILYPNPSDENMEVWSDPPAELFRIRDLSGKLLVEQIETGPAFQLDLSGFQKGLYFLEGYYADGRRVVPFIVN
jgi:lysophospholipase L1-like esterase